MTEHVESAGAAFALRFGHTPLATFRAPGRLTLTGGYAELAGLPAVSAAFEPGLIVTVADIDDPAVRISAPDLGGELEIARSATDVGGAIWERIARACVVGMAGVAPGRGAEILIQGRLSLNLGFPAALAAGVTAALRAAWGGEGALDPGTLMAVQRAAGLELSGAGARLALEAEAGRALRFDFEPAETASAELPPGLAFVLAGTGEDESAPEARAAFADLIAGGRVAATMLADQVGLDSGAPPRMVDVRDVEVVDILADDLPEQISPRQVSRGSSVTVEQMVQLNSVTLDAQRKLPCRKVALHLLGERDRAAEAMAAIGAGDAAALGAVLNASHDSHRQDVRCSTPALDRICAAMRKAGAHGARLAGAGFGGWAIALSPADRAGEVIEAAKAAGAVDAFEASICGPVAAAGPATAQATPGGQP